MTLLRVEREGTRHLDMVYMNDAQHDSRRGFTLIELMIVVAILAILAVVAVPAFIKYMRRAKTVEAIDQLDKISKGASYYYTAAHVSHKDGAKVLCQFPGNQGMTPDVTAQNCCGKSIDQDDDDRCDVNESLWGTATWAALSFQMNDQHYFGYTFSSNGSTLAAAAFTAAANADLDCDSILSTFERYGYGDENATRAECSARSAPAIYKRNGSE